MKWVHSQLYHFNIPSFILICIFVIVLGKMNMKKEVKKIHCDLELEIARVKNGLDAIYKRLDKK